MTSGIVNAKVRWYISFILGVLFGALVFFTLYGWEILNVTYEDWLLTGWYDLSQHYVGWQLFRASDWMFPVGLMDNGFYPYPISVIYSDSIPLFCVFFKILSPLLPETFQFFGIYGLLCFMLQGGFAKLLLRRVLNSEIKCCVACVPFVFCAPVWQRLYYHTALASHFLILAAFVLFMYRDRIENVYKRVALWCGLGMLCITIHFTIYSIVSVVFLGYAFWELLEKAGECKGAEEGRKKTMLLSFKRFFLFLLPYLLSSVFIFWILGGFYGNISGVSDGLGAYSANLNSLFNPIDYSRIIKEFPLIDCQYEGLSYIGIMAIIMIIPACAFFIRNFRDIFSKHRYFIISVFTTSVILWVIALSPIVTFNSHVLFEIPLPDFLYDAWSIYRASGRFLWPNMYLVILFVLYYASKEIKPYFGAVLVLGCLLQLFEFSEKTETISEEYSKEAVAHFAADRLDLYDWDGIKHLQFMHPYTFPEFYDDEVRDQMIGYTRFAIRHGMTVSNFHFSRDDMDKLKNRIEDCYLELFEEGPGEDTVYVFLRDGETYEEMKNTYKNARFIFTDKEILAVKEDKLQDNYSKRNK